jgi:beta-phosphoglucomutase-like phosphatase (HAD superfamily)
MIIIIFDIDGTLTDTTKVDDKCFMKAFKNVFGIDISNQNWAELNNVTDWGITEELFLKHKNRMPNYTEYDRMISEFMSQLKSELIRNKDQFKEIKGATNFFEFLTKKQNVKIGIATGGWEKSALLKLKTIGIEATKFVFSNSNHFKKREDILSDVIHRIKLKEKNKIDKVIYFGDGTWDYLTCEKLGIEFVGIDYSKNNKLKKLGVKTIFNDFSNVDLIYENLEI